MQDGNTSLKKLGQGTLIDEQFEGLFYVFSQQEPNLFNFCYLHLKHLTVSIRCATCTD